jgi:hypothetical protein
VGVPHCTEFYSGACLEAVVSGSVVPRIVVRATSVEGRGIVGVCLRSEGLAEV